MRSKTLDQAIRSGVCVGMTCVGLALLSLSPLQGALRALAVQLEHAPALRGHDPVELAQGKRVVGKEKISHPYEGYRYIFVTRKNLRRFQKEPDRYKIQNQFCLVDRSARARDDFFEAHQGKVYIFATEQCAEEFRSDPVRFVSEGG